jgi:hypothetical protein
MALYTEGFWLTHRYRCASSGYYRLERKLPGGYRIRKISAPFHGAQPTLSYPLITTGIHHRNIQRHPDFCTPADDRGLLDSLESERQRKGQALDRPACPRVRATPGKGASRERERESRAGDLPVRSPPVCGERPKGHADMTRSQQSGRPCRPPNASTEGNTTMPMPDDTLCFYVPDKPGIIDIAAERDGKTVGLYSGETIEQMAARYPGVRLGKLREIETASRAMFRSPPAEITKEHFHKMLEVLPPVAWTNRGHAETFNSPSAPTARSPPFFSASASAISRYRTTSPCAMTRSSPWSSPLRNPREEPDEQMARPDLPPHAARISQHHRRRKIRPHAP